MTVVKLPPKGVVDVEVVTPNVYVLTIRRFDGKDLSVHLTKNEVRYLGEYILLLLEIGG